MKRVDDKPSKVALEYKLTKIQGWLVCVVKNYQNVLKRFMFF